MATLLTTKQISERVRVHNFLEVT